MNIEKKEENSLTPVPIQTFLKTEFLAISDCILYKCPTKNCKAKSVFHPEFIKHGVAGCYVCDKIPNIAEKILKSKGYKFIEICYKSNQCCVKFMCDKNHIYVIHYDDLRQGKNCAECYKESVKSVKVELIKPRTCECKKLGVPGKICQHYNFAIIFPESAEEWDYCLNDILPHQISPASNKKFWFQCKECSEFYEQRIDSRAKNKRCPYCSGRKVSKNNNLAVTDPSIALEWDLDNNLLYCNEVTRGSQKIVGWICQVTEEKHRYSEKIANRTGPTQYGCHCKDKSYKQTVGGHEYFVQICSEVHNNKYSYHEKYVDAKSKINIYCPVISKNDGIPHGNFLQIPDDHKNGHGCSKCVREEKDSKGVVKLKKILYSIGYKEDQDYFCDHKLDGMKYISPLKLDFFLQTPNAKIALEFDGESHFFPIKCWGGQEALEINIKRDCSKDIYCMQNKISMLRFPYNADITEEYVKNIIKFCQTSHTYLSYTHLINLIKEKVDLQNIVVLENKSFEE